MIVSTPVGDIGTPLKCSTIVKTRMFPIEKDLNNEVDLSVLGKIIAKSIRVELVNVTRSEMRLKIELTVENRLKAILLYIKGVVFSIETAAIQLGYWEQKAVTGETDTLVFTATIDNSKTPKLWYNHIGNREKIDITIKVWFKQR